ncbi:MAG: hypothetical protein J2P46_15845 [Zavarzinella sp.]|nr:hypothetical protein [Zavarzinella sp.]
METRIADEVRRDPVLGPAVERADEVLRELFSKVPQPPSAMWKPTPLSQPTPMVDLELAEHDAYIARAFRVDQLADERAFRYAVLDLWGDSIMDAYHKSNDRLLKALRELRKEEERRELQVQGA